MKKFQQFLVLSATVLGAWMLFGNANDAQAAVTVSQPACAHEANNFTVTVNWTEGTGTLGYYIVDISTSPTFNYVWNKTAPAGSFSLANAPTGFVDSPYDSGPNPTPTLGLVAATTYYVRVYNGVHNPNSSPGVSFNVPECAAPAQPTVSGLPACATSATGYGGININWSGGANPAYGYYIDISDNGFSRWWTKNVPGGTTTTQAPAGFNGYTGVTGPMGNLAPGATYSVRIFNGEHSLTRTFSVPICVQPTCTNTGPNNYTVPYGTNTHTVYVSTSNATAVNFAVIPPGGPAVWYSGVSGGIGYYSATIDLSTYPQYGAFTVDVYMNNSTYTNQGCIFHPNFTRQSPMPATCTGAGPDGVVVYNEWGTHTINVTGVHSSATAVNIAVFRDGQTPIWYLSSAGTVQNLGSGNWRLVIDLSSHIPPNYSGTINVHVYMDNPFQNNTACDQANFQKAFRPATTAPVVTPTSTLPCTNDATYTVTLSWTGQARPAGGPLYSGYLVDAATVSDFSSHWNKNLPVGTTSTTAGTGFTPYLGVSGPLTLTTGTTYYFRVFNDSHSPTTTYTRLRCGSLEVVAQIPGGNWTLTHDSGYTKTGTGSQSFSPTACAGNTYYCIPVGTYTLTPALNSPSGYNGSATPTSHIVN